MSQFNYLPNSLPSSTFKSCVNPNGIYDCLAKLFAEIGAIALVNTEINQDFFPHNFGESWLMNYSYRDSNSSLFSANVFGEIVGEAHGMFLSAQADYTKMKVLACPSFATPPITNLFYNQLYTLDSIHNEDKKGEIRSGLSVDAKEIAKSICTGGELDVIILTGLPLYSVFKKGKSSGKDNNLTAATPPCRTLKKRSLTAASNEDLPLLPIASEAVLPTAEKQLVWPTAEDIFVGAEYNHQLMPDFGGPVFAFVKVKLIQLDWRDLGTLVVANMSIQVYVMISKNGDGTVQKIYYAILNSLWIMAGSDVLIMPPVPVLPRTLLASQNSNQTAATPALAALNFNLENTPGTFLASHASSNTPGSDTTVDGDNLDPTFDRELERTVNGGGLEASNVEDRLSPKKKLRK
ncbi:hypothetical protein F5876DRAFT_67706 [Lentinula aff. lateritia]|uniref:Uncharacterized protein n=1 Tax=Lentinula aff. lateritia TaxID=2804960 RepID=A0ACC1TT39_9AGAR|nr:hypothetical protein F5876DRAFT_67706 [Lentinula aff. lateritia]